MAFRLLPRSGVARTALSLRAGYLAARCAASSPSCWASAARSAGRSSSPLAVCGGSSAWISFGSNGMREVLAGERRQLPALFARFVQHPPQGAQTMKNSGLDGAQGAVQDLGDLFVPEAFAEPQHERLPLAIGQVCHQSPQALFPLGDLA